jgi:recombination protein RecT
MTGRARAGATKPEPQPSKEMERRKPLEQLLERYEGDFAAVLPKHTTPQAFIGLAMAYVRADPKLNQAAAFNQDSLIMALRRIAAWGHMPMKGVAALVPFRSDMAKHPEDNGWRIEAIEEVGGVKQRMFRAGGVKGVHCDVVRDKDRARFQRTTMKLPFHEYDEFIDPLDRGPLKAVYAWADLTDLLGGGTSPVVWLTKSQVLKLRAISKSGDAFWGPPWPNEGPWTEDMWKKSAVHKLSNEVPMSAEYLWQVHASQAASSTGFAGMPAPPPPEYSGSDYLDGDWSEPPPDDGEGESKPEWPDTAQPGQGAP